MCISERFESGRSLSELSTFGIGGAIRWYFEANTISDAQESIEWAHREKTPYFILGKGSNCLFDDRGFDGLVIHNKIDFCEFSGMEISVGAGYSFSLLGSQSARFDLSGLEFASGIPGSVGGAVFMNAGANGRETSDCLREVVFLTEEGAIETYARADLQFGYRASPFQKMKGCILSARFVLQPSREARKSQLEIISRRLKTQPYRDKSAGCVFCNPSKETPAGALIDRCNLKGLKVGGAEVSSVHANFIVNAGGASAADVLALIEMIQKQVYDQTGIRLEPELRRISFS